MAEQIVRKREKDSLAQSLGWFSLALGTAQVVAPGWMCWLVGAREDGISRIVMRAMGVREITQGIGILTRPRPTVWLWSRVGGDGVDLSLLGITGRKNSDGRARTAVAVANVLAVAAADVLESVRLGRESGRPRQGTLIRKAVTIKKPRDDVERAWAEADDLGSKVIKAGGAVHFHAAPGDRGTELSIEFVSAPRGGDLCAAAAKLAGKDLATELSDDLLRFKQVVETGEVVRSDSTPSGHLLREHAKQRPAQPLEERAR